MFTLREIEESGKALLEQITSPVPQFRILRDVLHVQPDEPAYLDAQNRLDSSRWVKELQETQLADGSWGRFHSRDSSLKNRFPTTELAIYRALSLGLDKENPLLQNTIGYIERVLQHQTGWTDPAEKHEGWPINIQFITAATLARIDLTHRLIEPYAHRWKEVIRCTFAEGNYDALAEKHVHLNLNNIWTKGKYLKLAGLYPLLLLSTPFADLSPEFERCLLEWIWYKSDGIYYVYGGNLSQPPEITSLHFQHWVDALSLLSHFKSWKAYCADALSWLYTQKSPEGLWDFGPASRNSFYFPLSENWQNPLDRKVDCSIMVLSLLRKFAEE